MIVIFCNEVQTQIHITVQLINNLANRCQWNMPNKFAITTDATDEQTRSSADAETVQHASQILGTFSCHKCLQMHHSICRMRFPIEAYIDLTNS